MVNLFRNSFISNGALRSQVSIWLVPCFPLMYLAFTIPAPQVDGNMVTWHFGFISMVSSCFWCQFFGIKNQSPAMGCPWTLSKRWDSQVESGLPHPDLCCCRRDILFCFSDVVGNLWWDHERPFYRLFVAHGFKGHILIPAGSEACQTTWATDKMLWGVDLGLQKRAKTFTTDRGPPT